MNNAMCTLKDKLIEDSIERNPIKRKNESIMDIIKQEILLEKTKRTKS